MLTIVLFLSTIRSYSPNYQDMFSIHEFFGDQMNVHVFELILLEVMVATLAAYFIAREYDAPGVLLKKLASSSLSRIVFACMVLLAALWTSVIPVAASGGNDVLLLIMEKFLLFVFILAALIAVSAVMFWFVVRVNKPTIKRLLES